MKKQITLFLFLAFAWAGLNAQITLASSDFPAPAVSRTIKVANGSSLTDSLSFAGTGTGQTWSMGDLTSLYTETRTLNFLAPGSMPNGNTFTAAQAGALMEVDSSGGFEVMREYNYWKTTGNQMEMIGKTIMMDTSNLFSSIPTGNLDTFHLNILPTDTVANNLYVSGYSRSDTSYFVAYIGTFNHREGFRRVISVDGSGTLETTLGTFDVLKVSETTYALKQDFQSAVLVGEDFDTSHTVTFWAKGQNWPLVIAHTDVAHTSYWEVEFLQGTPFVSVQNEFQVPFAVYPNPTTNSAKLRFENPIQENLILTVVNGIGQKVAEGSMLNQGSVDAEIDLSTYGAGIYHVVISNQKGETLFVQKLIKN